MTAAVTAATLVVTTDRRLTRPTARLTSPPVAMVVVASSRRSRNGSSVIAPDYGKGDAETPSCKGECVGRRGELSDSGVWPIRTPSSTPHPNLRARNRHESSSWNRLNSQSATETVGCRSSEEDESVEHTAQEACECGQECGDQSERSYSGCYP